jgi:hypothetical protein
MEEASASGSIQEEEVDLPGPIYDDTKGIINKETSIKWGEVYQMFNNQSFPQGAEDEL